MNTEDVKKLYRAAIAADDAYSVELRRVYGNNASMRRYLAHDTGDIALNDAMNTKLSADAAYLDACRAVNQLEH